MSLENIAWCLFADFELRILEGLPASDQQSTDFVFLSLQRSKTKLVSRCDPDSLLEAFRCCRKFCVSFGLNEAAQRLRQKGALCVPLWHSFVHVDALKFLQKLHTG